MGILFIQKRAKKLNLLESYIKFNVKHFHPKWPNCFPDIELVFIEIENGNEEFYTGAPCNKRNYFNKLKNEKSNSFLIIIYVKKLSIVFLMLVWFLCS